MPLSQANNRLYTRSSQLVGQNAAGLDIDGLSDIGEAIADADLFIIDNGGGGTNTKTAVTRIPTYVYSGVSGAITIDSSGVASLGTNAEGTNLTLSGNLTVNGSTVTVNSSTVTVDDPMFALADNNSADTVDIGWYGKYVDSGTKYSGLFRDASDSDMWKLFSTTGNSHAAPSTTVDTTSGFALANLSVNELTGTIATAAQGNITSLGTLSALTVDDVAVDGKVVTMTGSSGDTATLTVGTNGTLDITTTDTDAAAANIQITADGTAELAGTTVTLDSEGGITLDANGGTITFADDGASLGTITSSGYSGTSAVATLATTVTITDNEDTDEDNAVIFTAGGDVDGGNLGLESDGTLTYNPSSGTLTSTTFAGNLTGNASGSAATVTTAAQTNITSLGTLTGLTLDGDKSVTPGDGAMIHVDTSTITDSNTSGSGTAARYAHIAIEAPTLAATNSSVTTSDVATVYINNAATAGTNQTITRNWGLWLDAGNARFDGSIYSGTTEALSSAGLVTVANQSNITGVGTITSGTLGSGAVLGGVTVTLGSDAEGDVYYRNGSGVLVRLARGSDGEFLKLASGVPSWGSVSAGTATGLDATSASANLPIAKITNTHADATAGFLQFIKDPGSGQGADNDILGTISFLGTDASNNAPEELARMEAYVIEADHGSEAGGIKFYVAENDATMTAGLQVLGVKDADGEIDVTIGAGAASTTTIAGTLTMGSTAAMTNAGLLSVANQSGITGLGTIATGTWEATDIAVAHGGTGVSTLADNAILTGTGASAITAESTLSFTGDVLSASSSSADLPMIQLTNTHAGASAGKIRFNKDTGSGDTNDVMGTIEFFGTDAGENTHEKLAYIDSYVVDATAGGEQGGLRFYVAENAADLALGLSLVGQAEDGEIDATIAAGAASVTTIAGTLTMGTTAAMTNAGLLSVANQSGITGLGTISSGTWEATDVAVAHGGTGASTLLSNAILTGNGTSAIQAESTLLFSSNKLIPTATAHNAAGTALTMSAGATTAGTTDNIAGGALTFQGGQGKGSGAGGDIVFQTANAGGSGSSINSLATALTLSDDLSATFGGDIDIFRDANNADVALRLGTAAAESLTIQVLNGGSNKTAEEVHFSTATASGTANHGKMVFDVDGTDIATIDDGGIDIGSGLTFSINGTDIVSGDSLNSLSAGAIADGDSIAFIDANDSNATKKEAIADLATLFAGTGLTASSSIIGVDASQAINALTGGDLTIFDDANNADVSLKMGTSATEALSIQVLNGGSNKTAESVAFSTATASSTGDHGKFTFNVDGTDIFDVDDSGINLASGKTFRINGTTIDGDITSVVAGTGLTGGGTDGDVTLNVAAGNLIDVQADQVDVDLTEAAEAAIANGDYILFLDGGASGSHAKENIADVATLFAGTGLTASSSVIAVDASQAITALTGGDLTIYEDANNADVSLKLGTSAAESLTIQVLNGGSNKTAEEIHFSTATASGTANHGKMVFDIDGSDILTVDDGGIDIASGKTVAINGTDIVSAAGAITGITSLLATDIKIGEDDQTKIDFEDVNTINFYANNAKEVVLAENSISPGTSDGTALGTTSLMWSDLFLADGGVINFNNGDVLLTQSSNLITLTGGGLVVGVDDTGHDVKFFGASAGAYMEWDESADQLRIMGASADATTSTGKLLLATSLTDINANDVLGKVEFQAPHEAGGTDAITVAAAIEAVAQGTFSSSVNATDILFKTGHSEAATEKFRFTSQGEIGIGGTNYGTSGQILTSGGAGAAPSWADAAGGGGTFTATANGAISAGDRVSLRSDGDVEKCEALQTGKAFGTAASPNGTEFETGQTYYQSAGFDPDNNKIGVGYRDAGNSNYPTIVVGAITDAAAGDLAFGTPVVVESASSTQDFRGMAYDTSVDRFVFVYTTSSGIRAVVWAVNNTSTHTITKGDVQSVDNSSKHVSSVFDSNANRVLVSYLDSDDSNKLIAQAFTVRGSTDNDIQSAGAKLFISATSSDPPLLCFDSNDNKVMIMYRESTDSYYPYARALTIDASDNSIAGGTAVRLTNDNSMSNAGNGGWLVHDSALNINVASHQGNASEFEAWVFTSASGTITAGQHILINDTTDATTMGNFVSGVYDPDNAKVIFFHGQSGILATVGVISGTGADATFTIEARAKIHKRASSLYSEDVSGGGNVEYVDSIYDTNSNKTVLLYKSTSGDTGNFALVPILPKNSTAFIGFSNDAVSNDATATITTTGGVATGQSSLTIGSEYFVDSSGALSTTSGTVFAGKALTATTVLVNAPRV